MGTDTSVGPEPPERGTLLSRQPQCRTCRHEEHWLSCDWCGCTADPLQHAATAWVMAPA